MDQGDVLGPQRVIGEPPLPARPQGGGRPQGLAVASITSASSRRTSGIVVVGISAAGAIACRAASMRAKLSRKTGDGAAGSTMCHCGPEAVTVTAGVPMIRG